MKKTILLADSNETRLLENEKFLSAYFNVEPFTELSDILVMLKHRKYDYAFMDKDLGFDIIQIVRKQHPNLEIHVGGEDWEDDEVERYRKAGFEALYQYPFDPQDILELLQTELVSSPIQTKPVHKIQAAEVNDFNVGLTDELHKPVKKVLNRNRGEFKRHEVMDISKRDLKPNDNDYTNIHSIIGFYSPKGGVGKTTTSINTAVALAQGLPNHSVVIVDFDIFFGNVATTLRLDPKRTVLDWINAPEHADKNMVQSLLIQHESGLWVLPAPTRTIDESEITDKVAKKIIVNLERYFDIIIIDMGPVYRDSNIVAYDMAHKIFVVSDLDRITLKDIYDLQGDFPLLGIPIEKISMILNMVTGKEGITIKQARDLLPFAIAGVLPYETKMKAILNNREQTIIEAMPNSPYSQQIYNLIYKALGVNVKPKEAKKSWLSFFKRRSVEN